MKLMDVLRELSEGNLNTFYVKRDPTIKLVIKDGKADLSPIQYVFPGEEWGCEVEECSCYKLGESLNSGMKCSNCGREL